MNDYLNGASFFIGDDRNDILHYGTKRHSGRYPYGSGFDPYQHEPFYSKVQDLRDQGFTDDQIAKQFDMSSTQFRRQLSVSRAVERENMRQQAIALRDKGYGASAIGREMGLAESTVRSLLDEATAHRQNIAANTANALQDAVDTHRYVDIGPGVNQEFGGITETRFDTAVKMCEEKGYKVQYLRINQMGTNRKTTMTVLTPADCEYSELLEHRFDIYTPGVEKVYLDGEVIKCGLEPPKSVDSKRIMIRYGEQGGGDKEGIIELRRGVDDISLGRADYAQVRIAVDGTHYMKGMAHYSDDMPPGIDIIYNSKKPSLTPPKGEGDATIFKKMKNDPDNPFGASIKDEDALRMAQRYYIDSKGNKQLSCINVVNEEGDWGKWSKNIPSQMLSKQHPALAKRQLDLDYNDRLQQFNDICALTNPTIKKKLLGEFALECQSAAIDLKAAPFPRQATHVILPVPSLKDNEIYAPNYPEGSTLYLIRFPHGGTFEIPELRVTHSNPEARSFMNNAPDAVGINAHVASRLSGADFDGDTVLCIPRSNKVKLKTQPELQGLKGFDPQAAYPAYPGMPQMKSETKQNEMGRITNLIADMTLQGATPDELARAVRHSMVIIDAEKHHLNYKKSYEDNRIGELKKIYQNKGDGETGASTLISRAKNPVYVNARKDITYFAPYNAEKGTGNVDPKTGRIIYKETGEMRTTGTLKTKNAEGKTESQKVTLYLDKKTGKQYVYITEGTKRKKVDASTLDISNVKTERVTQKSGQMAEVIANGGDAYSLTSGGSKEHPGTQIEAVYADYANKCIALSNEAMKEYISTPRLKYDPEAKKRYSAEVASLNEKVKRAQTNAPKERQAQLLANKSYIAKLEENPDLDKEHQRKLKGQELTRARIIVGAKKSDVRIDITDSEWEAIQAGAVSDSFLQKILNNTDEDDLKKRAMPRESRSISDSQRNLIKSMDGAGYTTQEIANRLGISQSSISKIIAA